jgi:chromosome segregation ATPase
VSRIRAGLFTSDETHQLAVSISSMITDQVRGDLSDLEARLKERSETVERRVSEALEQLTQAQQKDQKELTTMLAALKEGTQTHQTELRKRVDMVGQVLNEGQKTSGKRLAYIANKLEPIEKVAERVQTVVEETVALKTSIESVGRAVVQQKAAGERSESLLTKLDRQLAAVPEMLRQQWSESVEPALDGVAQCSQSAESAVASVSQSVARHSSTSEEWFNRIFEQVNTLVEMAQQEPKANKWWRKS